MTPQQKNVISGLVLSSFVMNACSFCVRCRVLGHLCGCFCCRSLCSDIFRRTYHGSISSRCSNYLCNIAYRHRLRDTANNSSNQQQGRVLSLRRGPAGKPHDNRSIDRLGRQEGAAGWSHPSGIPVGMGSSPACKIRSDHSQTLSDVSVHVSTHTMTQ